MGEETATESASDAATARRNADARATVLGWARRTIDLVPTSWLAAGAGAVLLAGTAAFGGLEAAPAEPIPQLAAGDTYTGSDLEMTVVGVELWSEQGNSAIDPDPDKGEKVLVVVLDVVNTFEKPRSTGLALKGLALEGIDGELAPSRADDGRIGPTLQPGVPARLLLSHVVGPGEVADGEQLILSLPDSTRRMATAVGRGAYWDDIRVGATAMLTVEEVPAL